MNLWLARHAQPLIPSGICYGATDVIADETLTQQAAQALAKVLPLGTLCYVSPMLRCCQLALNLAHLRQDLNINISRCNDARLVEMNFGRYEGQAWADIPKAAMDAWTADFGEHRFGGHESANEVLKRVLAALKDSQTASKNSNTNDVLWISHAGVMQAVSLLNQSIFQVSGTIQWPRDVPNYGEFRCVKIEI
jgi:alpha-ribazole phosphatase